eukprot:7917382-Alexandrium_andersonii.AAC.1
MDKCFTQQTLVKAKKKDPEVLCKILYFLTAESPDDPVPCHGPKEFTKMFCACVQQLGLRSKHLNINESEGGH